MLLVTSFLGTWLGIYNLARRLGNNPSFVEEYSMMVQHPVRKGTIDCLHFTALFGMESMRDELEGECDTSEPSWKPLNLIVIP